MDPISASRTTVEVRPGTKDRLNAVKGPLTTDQLINLALDHLPPERVAEIYQEWQTIALNALTPETKPKPRFPWQR